MFECFACMCVCIPHVCLAPMEVRIGALDRMALDLWMV